MHLLIHLKKKKKEKKKICTKREPSKKVTVPVNTFKCIYTHTISQILWVTVLYVFLYEVGLSVYFQFSWTCSWIVCTFYHENILSDRCKVLFSLWINFIRLKKKSIILWLVFFLHELLFVVNMWHISNLWLFLSVRIKAVIRTLCLPSHMDVVAVNKRLFCFFGISFSCICAH